EIKGSGGRALAVQANVARRPDVERLFAEAKKAFGRVDILVNNAGVYQFTPLEEISEEAFHKHFDTNVLGLLLASKEAAKYFAPTAVFLASGDAAYITGETIRVAGGLR